MQYTIFRGQYAAATCRRERGGGNLQDALDEAGQEGGADARERPDKVGLAERGVEGAGRAPHTPAGGVPHRLLQELVVRLRPRPHHRQPVLPQQELRLRVPGAPAATAVLARPIAVACAALRADGRIGAALRGAILGARRGGLSGWVAR